MGLKKISNRIYYLPHEVETDRPMLSYINGNRLSLCIDAGNSKKHIDKFYGLLLKNELKKPDFTVITHWHWDHTFAMKSISGLSIAHGKTNEYLNDEREKIKSQEYINYLKSDDKCMDLEYADGEELIITSSDIEYKNKLEIDLGGLTAKIFHVISPHSEDTTIIYIPEEEILFLGDSTSEDFYNDGYMDKNKLNKLLKTIEYI